MMADENQPSSSSTVPETTSPKPLVEGENEEEVSETKSESETNTQHKMANGYAKHVDNNNAEEDTNANHIHEETTSKEVAQVASSDHSLEPEHENNNSADSLEEDNNDDYVEEKTYTSRLDQALVMKKTDEVVTEAVVSTSTVEEVSVSEEAVQKESVAEGNVSTTTEECNGEVLEPAATPQEAAVKLEEQVSSTEDATTEKEMMEISSEQVIVHEEVITSTSISEVTHQEQEVKETFMEIQMKTSEAEKIVHEDDDDDGYVRVEECLPQVDSTDDLQPRPESASEQNIVEEHEVTTTNGYEEHPPSPAALSESAQEDKSPQPEMEQFVKSGGVKRILPGVQKTEQPYSSCTTETKIAMEIREMREREEELRMMREQALLSPVVSPVPPKSPVGRSPSPCLKEMHSPTPQGPGYRVSSVFGHKGTTSPSPPVFADDDKKPFKGFSKESAVEKEIRLARDREEELRKQKGLPPREDDSYVKPSQVKSSQVRVFGKIATANNASVKQAATAKIQMEIEEQTQREMALRESGHIQTISQERTDAKVAKLKNSESPQTNGTSHALANGNYSNGRASPDVGGAYKRSSPSPTGARPASIFSQSNAVPKGNISMHKFIASKGKETTFSAPRNGGPFQPKEETKSAVPPPMVKLKRNLSVESKIQQEILEMKQREEELKKLHMNRTNENFEMEGNGIDLEMNQKNNLIEYENGNGVMEEEISPRHNKLIAQWEQRIQKAES